MLLGPRKAFVASCYPHHRTTVEFVCFQHRKGYFHDIVPASNGNNQKKLTTYILVHLCRLNVLAVIVKDVNILVSI